MNIPKRIKELLDRKQELINRNSEKLSASVVRLQSKLMDAIIDDVILEMDIVDGVIQDTAKNYRLIASLDKTFNAFSLTQAEALLPQLTSATNAISNLSNEYFLMTVTPDLLKRFDKVVEGAKEITDLRFGLKGGKFVRGGPIESLISEFGGTEVKQLMAKAVSGNMDKREFLKQMRDFVTGTDEKPGISERKWKQFAYDVYQQHDAAYNKIISHLLYLVAKMVYFLSKQPNYAISPVDLNILPNFKPATLRKFQVEGYRVEVAAHTGGAFQMARSNVVRDLCAEKKHFQKGDYMIGHWYRRHNINPAYLLDLEMRHIGLNQSSQNYIL